MKTIKYTIAFLSAVVFLFSCNRVENLSFEDFDKNNDKEISLEEFEDVFTANYYRDWDNDDDPYLDDEDFHTGVYDAFDADDDQMLTEEEWLYGFDYYYGNYIVTDFNDLDLDDDEHISYEEYYNSLGETNFYKDWDRDADDRISEEELATGVFTIWDVDNSGALEADEFEEFDSYYLDI